MTTIQHTPDCTAAQAEFQRQYDAYAERWPDRCEMCDGTGGRYYRYDPSPSGVALSPGYFWDFATCADCVDVGKCARCAGPIDEDGNPCPVCGWKYDTHDHPGEPPECWCWDTAESRREEEEAFRRYEAMQNESDTPA